MIQWFCVLSFNQANVHDLYKQAKLEIHGAFFLFFGIVGIVVIGAFTKIHFEGPSCPSPAKMTGTISISFLFKLWQTWRIWKTQLLLRFSCWCHGLMLLTKIDKLLWSSYSHKHFRETEKCWKNIINFVFFISIILLAICFNPPHLIS